jgi:hypothetical protein
MNTVQLEWEKFRDKTNLTLAPINIQRTGKAAFYSGVLACLHLHQSAIHAGHSEEACVAMVNGWWDEMGMFDEEVRKS